MAQQRSTVYHSWKSRNDFPINIHPILRVELMPKEAPQCRKMVNDRPA